MRASGRPLYDRAVHVRRALLLFAIVLGLAALVAGLSNSDENSDPPQEPAGAAPPAGAPRGEAELVFNAARPRRRVLASGQAAEVLVEVHLAGQVEIPALGLSASADPVTPARFDVLEDGPASYPILFAPAEGSEATEPQRAGTLVVRAVAPQ
jgi:hypothetical protein